jgi:hypothetical protein
MQPMFRHNSPPLEGAGGGHLRSKNYATYIQAQFPSFGGGRGRSFTGVKNMQPI